MLNWQMVSLLQYRYLVTAQLACTKAGILYCSSLSFIYGKRIIVCALNKIVLYTSMSSYSFRNKVGEGSSLLQRSAGVEINGGGSEELAHRCCHLPNILISIKGIFLAFISAIFHSLSAIIVSHVTSVSVPEFCLVKFTSTAVFSLPVVVKRGATPIADKCTAFHLILYGILLYLLVLTRCLAFQLLPVEDATVIVYASPIFVIIFSRIFLKEAIYAVHIVAIILILIGVCFVIKLPLLIVKGREALGAFDKVTYVSGVSSAVVSTIISAIMYVTARKLIENDLNIWFINFSSSIISMICSVIGLLSSETLNIPKCGKVGLLILGYAFASWLGQSFFQYAMSLENAGPVALVRSAGGIVLVFIWQIIIFGEIPSYLSISGAILSIISIVLIGFAKFKKTVFSCCKDSLE